MSIEPVWIGERPVGPGEPCMVVAEIGINHNGDVETAERLIDEAADAGCEAVKFQKRTVDVVYTPEELAAPRESPFGTTNGELKWGLEFGEKRYRRVKERCAGRGVQWWVSCWDEGSVDFMEKHFNPPCYKIASASLTDDKLLRHHRQTGRPIILSTGMSELEEIDHAVEVLGTENLIILHCNSSYPCEDDEINLGVMATLRGRYGVPVGYSGHERGLATSVGAAVLEACMVERHITLDHTMRGSDHAASVEPQGFKRMVRDIRAVEAARGDGVKRVYDSEVPARDKLRRVG